MMMLLQKKVDTMIGIQYAGHYKETDDRYIICIAIKRRERMWKDKQEGRLKP